MMWLFLITNENVDEDSRCEVPYEMMKCRSSLKIAIAKGKGDNL